MGAQTKPRGRTSSLLPCEFAQLPDALFANLSRLLMEGGTIADHVLRMTAQLNRKNTAEPETIEDIQAQAQMARQRKHRRYSEGISAFRANKGVSMLRTLGRLQPILLQEAILLLVHRAKATGGEVCSIT
jgi:hypothetical protein